MLFRSQLKTVAAALGRERAKFAALGWTEMGVFWDWASLYQRDPALWRPFMTGPMSVADEELSEAQAANQAENDMLRSRCREEADRAPANCPAYSANQTLQRKRKKFRVLQCT